MRPGSLLRRVYGALVRLYPPGFRRRFGAEMCDLFVDRARGRGACAAWLRAIRDLAWHVPAAWADEWPERRADRTGALGRQRRRSMDLVQQHMRDAVRSLAAAPAYAAVVVLILAIGIGATTAMFSVVDAALIRPLPFPAAAQLVRINDSIDGGRSSVAYPNFLDWRSVPAVERAAAFARSDVNFSAAGDAERLQAIAATPEIFDLAGVRPIAGRTFVAADEQPGSPPVLVLSEGLWNRRFGRDPEAVGRVAVVDGQTEVIVGIVPGVPGLETAVWRPLRQSPLLTRRNHFLTAFARLTPRASIAEARQQLAVVALRLQHEHPETNAEWTAAVAPLQDDLTANARPMVAAGFGAVALVLVIGAANIANLMLSRASGRRREFAIRAALGAGRGRIARQLLTESTLLSLVGGLAGVAVAWLAVRGAGPLVERQLRLVNGVAVNPAVLAFACAISVGVGLLFGWLPALDAGRRDPYGVLKAGGDSPIASGWPRLTTVLTVVEFALSIVLLTGAGLLANSLVRLSQVNPGFEPDGVLTIRLAPPRAKYSSPAAVADFYRSILDAARAAPGVRAAAAVSALAITPGSTQRGYIRDGDPIPARRDVRLALYHLVSAEYFTTMRIPLQGRAFDAGDRAAGEPVAIVSESMARELWPGESAIGRRIRIHTDEPFARTIVGVARDVKQVGLDRPSYPSYFVPFDQAPRAAMSLVVRTDMALDRVVPEIRRRIAAIDPDLPLYDVQAYDEILRAYFAPRRLSTAVLGAFAAVAVGLAAIGIYGVMASAVSRRVREIGVRMAIGARRADVVALVVGDGLRRAAIGMALGVPFAWMAARSLGATLFGVAPGDPWTYAAAVAVLTLAAAAACYIPARRASRVDPLVMLKVE